MNAQVARKITKKKAFISAYARLNGNVTLTCKSIGISRRIYYTWAEEDKKFKQEVDDSYEEVKDWVESKLLKLIENDNVTAIIFYLKTQCKDRGYIEPKSGDENINKHIDLKEFAEAIRNNYESE